MIADLLVDAGRSCRQFIIKSIKQNALASGDQAFHVGSSEIEMPDFWILELLVPVTDPGKRSVHDDPSGHSRGVKRRQRVADHVADVVRDESNILNSQL